MIRRLNDIIRSLLIHVIFLLRFGLRPFTPLPISTTYSRPNASTTILLPSHSISATPHTITYGYSAVLATLTLPPLNHTNFTLAPSAAFFSDILPIIVAIVAMTHPPAKSTSPVTSHLTNGLSLIPPPSPLTYTFLDDTPPPIFHFSHPTPAPSTQHQPPTSFLFTYSRRPKPPTPPNPPPSNPTLTTPVPAPSHCTPTQPSSQNTHPMTTRSKARHAFTTSTLSPVPKSYAKALADPNWLQAMHAEFRALQENDTWELVPRPRDSPVIRCMWLFRHKFKSDGSLERYKARVVVNGKS